MKRTDINGSEHQGRQPARCGGVGVDTLLHQITNIISASDNYVTADARTMQIIFLSIKKIYDINCQRYSQIRNCLNNKILQARTIVRYVTNSVKNYTKDMLSINIVFYKFENLFGVVLNIISVT